LGLRPGPGKPRRVPSMEGAENLGSGQGMSARVRFKRGLRHDTKTSPCRPQMPPRERPSA